MREIHRRMRRSLQELHDAGEAPQGRVLEHLAGCAACARFRETLGVVSVEMKAREAAAALRPAPDYALIFSRAESARARPRSVIQWFRGRIAFRAPKARMRLIFVSAAVVPVICIALAVGLRLQTGAKTRSGVQSFVEDLYSVSFLEGAEYAGAENTVPQADAALEGWLTDLSNSSTGSGFFDAP